MKEIYCREAWPAGATRAKPGHNASPYGKTS